MTRVLTIPTKPPLPPLLARKLYKTGQTRGARENEVYQNRVNRNSTVLIRYDQWDLCRTPEDCPEGYENGSIVLIPPSWYMSGQAEADLILADKGLTLGTNALLFYEKRIDWDKYSLPPGAGLANGRKFIPAKSRIAPLGGTYIARVIATTSDGSHAISEGFNTRSPRGGGIRVYEYASTKTMSEAKLQLEALVWLSTGSVATMSNNGMSELDANVRKANIFTLAEDRGLLDFERLRKARLVNNDNYTTCPLCMEEITAEGFLKREEQAEGRETWNLTTTELSLFHVEELRVGKLQHKPYNLGWGHGHCNVVAKDAGIVPTLRWMKEVIDRNLSVVSTIEDVDRSVEEGVGG